MRILPFLIYALGVFVAAAILVYPTWLLVQAAGATSIPFHKLCFRLLEALALLGLWPLMRYLGLNNLAEWGFARGAVRASPTRGLVNGFLVGTGLLAGVVAILLAADIREFRVELSVTPGTIADVVSKAVLAAFVIALVEETWFRGALQRALETRFQWVGAVTATALLYGLVHFVRPDVQVPVAEVGWSSGVTVIAGSFGRFLNPEITDSLAALVAVGVLLALVRHHTGRIWECIGLHAGFVVVIRLTRKLTQVQPESSQAWLVGDFDGVIGWLGFAVFILAIIAYWRLKMSDSFANA